MIQYTPVIAIGKWVAPFGLAAVALLAVEQTTIITAGIAAFQVLAVAFLGYRQHTRESRAKVDQSRTDADLEAAKLTSAEAIARITGQDRLIDQLQEQSKSDQAQLNAARDLVANLEMDNRTLHQRLTKLEVGVIRLSSQIEDHDLVPVWVITT